MKEGDYMKKILALLVATFLCSSTFMITPLYAAEVVDSNEEITEISPKYSQTQKISKTFNYQSKTYTLNTTWTINVDNNTGKLNSASLSGATSTLPDPLYQSTSVYDSERLNNNQIKYWLSVKIKKYGITM